jgi:hypothetical protein
MFGLRAGRANQQRSSERGFWEMTTCTSRAGRAWIRSCSHNQSRELASAAILPARGEGRN